MKLLTKLVSVLAAGVALCAVSVPASALVLSYEDIVTGTTPASSSSPWLVATITNDEGGVQVSLEINVDDPEFVTDVYFSLGGSYTFGGLIGTSPNVVACNGNSPANTGPWELCVGFAPSDHVNDSTITFSLRGLSVNNFQANAAGWFTVAHVQGISPNCSGWVGAYDGDGRVEPSEGGVCSATSVPEPGTLGLMLLGLAAIGFSMGRRAMPRASLSA